jgi:hypothetical protein
VGHLTDIIGGKAHGSPHQATSRRTAPHRAGLRLVADMLCRNSHVNLLEGFDLDGFDD